MKLIAMLVVLALVVFFVGGLVLPPDYEVRRELVIDAAPEAIHAVVADLHTWASWSPYHAEDPGMWVRYSGPDAGPGHKQDWQSEFVPDGSIEILESDPATGVTYRLWLADTDRTVESRIAFEPVESGTRVVWSLSGDAGASLIGRWHALFTEGSVGPAYEAGLSRLARLAGLE